VTSALVLVAARRAFEPRGADGIVSAVYDDSRRILVMPYDPAKIVPAPPRHVPARDEEEGPVYDENNPPTMRDYIKAANQARKNLKKLES